jgi:hypothetical protein
MHISKIFMYIPVVAARGPSAASIRALKVAKAADKEGL